MLCFELKHSPKPAEFSHPLKKFIAGFYNEDPSNFSKAIHDMEQLRVAACSASKDVAGVTVLKRYYSQLRSLQNRFPMTDDGAACVAFMWTDLYSGRAFNIADVKYELSSILYNIGALHSQLGALEDRTGAEGMKSACAHFQMAAWAFQHNRDSYPQPKGCDLSHDLLTFYSLVMLGQSQECILEKSLLDNRKPTISAKIAAQIVDFYGKAMNHLTADIKQIVGSKIYLQWRRICKMNASYYGAVAALHMGMGAEEERAYGLRVAWYRDAMRLLTDALHAARDLSIDDMLSFTVDVIGGKLNAAEKENDFVYHDKVPAAESLPEVKGAVLVKGIPFDPCDPEISGPDLFASLIPMGAHEASSIYSEKKAQILRRISDNVEDKNAELAAYESNLSMDHNTLKAILVKPSLPPDVIESCARFHTRRTAVSDLNNQLARLHKMAEDIAILLQEADAQMKEARPGGVTSNVVADLRAELNKYREIHTHSSRSNDTLKDALKAHDEKLTLLQYTPDVLQQKLPFVIEATTDDAKVITEMIRLLDKIDEMKLQRNKLFTDLRDAIRNDDITKLIVANAQEDLNEVFEKALSKHEQAIAVLEKNLRAQENILKAVTVANANAAEVRLNLEQARQPWNAAIEGLRASAKAFDEIEAQTLKGLDFFDNFHGNVSKLVSRLKSVLQVEREQEERLKMRQAAESAAVAAATATSNNAPATGQPGQQVADIGAYIGHADLSSSYTASQIATSQLGVAPYLSGGTQAAPKLKDYLAMMKKAKQQGTNGTDSGNEYIPQAMPGSPGISLAASSGITSISTIGPATTLSSLTNAYGSPQISVLHGIQQPHPYPQGCSTAATQNLTNSATSHVPLATCTHVVSTPATNVSATMRPTSTLLGYQDSGVYHVPLPAGHLEQAARPPTTLMVSSQPQPTTSRAVGQTIQQPSTFTTQQQSQFYNAYNTSNLGYQMHGGTANYAVSYGSYAHLYATPQIASTAAENTATSSATSGVPTATCTAPSAISSTMNSANYYGNAQGTTGTTSVNTSITSTNYSCTARYQYPQQYAYAGSYSGYPTLASTAIVSSQPTAIASVNCNSSVLAQSSVPTIASQASVIPPMLSRAVSITGASARATAVGGLAGAYNGSYATCTGGTVPTPYPPQQISYASTYGQLCETNVAAAASSLGATCGTTTTVTTNEAITAATNTAPAASVASGANGAIAVTDAATVHQTYQTTYQWSGYGNLSQVTFTASPNKYTSSGTGSVSYSNASATTSTAYSRQQYPQYYQQYVQQYQQYNNRQETTSTASSVIHQQAGQSVASTATNGFATPAANMYGANSQQANKNQPSIDAYYQQLALGSVQPASYGTQLQSSQTVTTQYTPHTVSSVGPATARSVANNLLDESPQLSVTPDGGVLASVLQPTIVSKSSLNNNESKMESDVSSNADDDVSRKSNGVVGIARATEVRSITKSDCDNLNSTGVPPSTEVPADDANSARSLEPAATVTTCRNQPDTSTSSGPVSADPLNNSQVVQDLKNTYEKLDNMTALKLNSRWKEYRDNQEAEARTLKISVGRICSMKNRFPDIMPYDYNRVVLTSSKDDYINASFVTSSIESEPNYIITQAPLATTLEDFWTMVWEQRAETILSLSSFQELSSQLFFPSKKGTSQNYGPFNVTVLSFSEREAGLFTERLLAINGPQGLTRNVILVHVTQWTREALFQIGLAEHVLDLHVKQRRSHNPPIVIQCLGGCGRSGILAFALRWISHLRVGRVPSDAMPILRQLTRARKLLLLEQDQLRTCLEIALLSIKTALQTRGLMHAVPAAITTLDQMDEKQRKGQALSAEERILQDLMQGFQAKTKITKESFEKPRGFDAASGGGDPADPLSQLDPLWSLKK